MASDRARVRRDGDRDHPREQHPANVRDHHQPAFQPVSERAEGIRSMSETPQAQKKTSPEVPVPLEQPQGRTCRSVRSVASPSLTAVELLDN
jgi:hypothetical protein